MLVNLVHKAHSMLEVQWDDGEGGTILALAPQARNSRGFQKLVKIIQKRDLRHLIQDTVL